MKKITLIFTASIIATIAITLLVTSLAVPEFFELRAPSVTELGATPDGTFYWPRGIAQNSTNFIFIADTQNSRGQIFYPDGTFLKTFGFPGNDPNDGSLNQPFGIAINGSDYVFVADTFTNVIKIYNHTGIYERTIGTAGTGTDEYYYPSGVTMNSTHILIADTFNNRIVITDLLGDSVQEIP